MGAFLLIHLLGESLKIKEGMITTKKPLFSVVAFEQSIMKLIRLGGTQCFACQYLLSVFTKVNNHRALIFNDLLFS
jgi:hypothetical protein